jgi:hypothetical protein
VGDLRLLNLKEEELIIIIKVIRVRVPGALVKFDRHVM